MLPEPVAKSRRTSKLHVHFTFQLGVFDFFAINMLGLDLLEMRISFEL